MEGEITDKSSTALKIYSVEKYRVRSTFLTFLINYRQQYFFNSIIINWLSLCPSEVP